MSTTTLRLESIGDDARAALKAYRSGKMTKKPSPREMTLMLKMQRMSPWVAEVIWIGADGVPERLFVKGRKSYTEANGTGSRGVYFYYHLDKNKIYEVQAPRTWNKCERFFCRHDGERWIKMDMTEAAKWLDRR